MPCFTSTMQQPWQPMTGFVVANLADIHANLDKADTAFFSPAGKAYIAQIARRAARL